MLRSPAEFRVQINLQKSAVPVGKKNGQKDE